MDNYDFEEMTFAEYLIFELKVLTYEEFESKYFRYFLYQGYYKGYKNYCNKNCIMSETVYFR